jgi:hypothetical protein
MSRWKLLALALVETFAIALGVCLVLLDFGYILGVPRLGRQLMTENVVGSADVVGDDHDVPQRQVSGRSTG